MRIPGPCEAHAPIDIDGGRCEQTLAPPTFRTMMAAVPCRNLDSLAPAGWLPQEAMTGDWHGVVTRYGMDGSPVDVPIRVAEHCRTDGGVAELIEFGPIPFPPGASVAPMARGPIAAADVEREELQAAART